MNTYENTHIIADNVGKNILFCQNITKVFKTELNIHGLVRKNL